MARYIIQYAHTDIRLPDDECDPMGVYAQDESGVVTQAVALDPAILAEKIGVDPRYFEMWSDLAGVQASQKLWRYDESLNRDVPVPASDPHWLSILAQPTLVNWYRFSGIHERPGSAAEVAAAVAKELQTARNLTVT